MADDRRLWDRVEDEPGRWFSRFSAYRLQGPGRSIESVYRAECEANKREVKRPSKVWYERAEEWQWKARSSAWDQYLLDQAAAEIEARWRKKIMTDVEVLGRMSEMGRTNINDFVKLGIDGHIVGFDEQALEERGYLVKKISSSQGKTESRSIEMYDAKDAVKTMGAHHKVFTGEDDRKDSITPGSFVLDADHLAKSFVDVHRDVLNRRHMEYLLKGGRGSTKSSFASLEIVFLLINHPNIHAVAMRQVADTLRNSVYAQFVWAIHMMELESQFKFTTSPLEIEYKKTGQKIYFCGANRPEMIKSIKPRFGHIGILWLEELDQFKGPEAVRKIEQSVIRGGEEAWEFKTYNPPPTAANWVNKYVQIPKENQLQHHSTYLDVPKEWLGQTFIDEAEHLKEVNPTAYAHEYMGEVTGTGGLVFENVQVRDITDEEIAQFDRVLQGVDWGYYPDPWAWNKMHYDAGRMTLYIFDELRLFKASNKDTYDALVKKGVTPDQLIIADSAEPKSIGDYRDYGLSCRGAEKGPESVKYSMKWLQSLAAIVIDPTRCPETATEFLEYELEQDPDGNFISEYPDKNNHHIDDVRYATNFIWKRRGQ